MENNLAAHLWNATIQGSLFVCGVWITCLILRRLPAVGKCWLWRLVSVKFVLALAIAVSMPIAVGSDHPVGQVEHAIFRSVPQLGPAASTHTAQVSGIDRAGDPFTIATVAKPKVEPLAILIALWFAGAVFFLAKGLAALWRARQILGRSERFTLPAISFSIESVYASCAPLRIRTTDEIAAPALIGLVKPSIVFPSDLGGASTEAVASALAHELAHLKRRDAAWIVLAELVKALFWFDPLAWIACREQRLEAEIAADQMARRWIEISPKEYGRHLLEWIDLTPGRRTSLRAVPGLLPATHELVRRMREMSWTRYDHRSTVALAALLALPLTLGLAPLKFVAVGSNGLAETAWPKYHGGPENNGRGTGAGATGVKLWSFKTGSDIESTPVIGADGTLYFGSGDHKVYALDRSNGARKWVFESDGPVMSSPAIGADGTVFIGSEDGTVYALDGATGAKKWSYKTFGMVYPGPAIGSDGTIYIGSWDRNVYALDPSTGLRKWLFSTGGPVTSSAAVGQDGTVYVGSHDKHLYALDGATGALKWSFGAGDTVNSPSIGPDGTVFVSSWDGKIYALNGATGRKKWDYQTGDIVDTCPAIGLDGTVYVGSEDGRVYALDGATGNRIWASIRTGAVVGSPVIGSDGTIYSSSGSHSGERSFFALNGATGKEKWSIETGSLVCSCASLSSDGTLYVGDDLGYVYAIH